MLPIICESFTLQLSIKEVKSIWFRNPQKVNILRESFHIYVKVKIKVDESGREVLRLLNTSFSLDLVLMRISHSDRNPTSTKQSFCPLAINWWKKRKVWYLHSSASNKIATALLK